MIIEILSQEFAVCKVKNLKEVNFNEIFTFLSKTDEELSLVCPIESVPENSLEVEKDWRAFRIKGVLDFSLIGILSKISGILSDNGIGIFVISTFNTDYVLVKKNSLDKAKLKLSENGYKFIN
ncbi:MAG: ACT domain-containing protein [Spirochaetaceae bacterium]|nr:ACT domain-containing protein [Spirochaetaceae bacterium]